MTQISASMVKELREKTGAGMMDAKKALNETDGDMDAAVDHLRKKGLAKAEKKSSRTAADGLVAIRTEGNTGVVAEVNAETDFVARNEQFQTYVSDVTQRILENKIDTSEYSDPNSDAGARIQEELTDLIAQIGEKMTFRRSLKLSVDQGIVAGYVHNAVAGNMGTIGVLVALESEGDEQALNALGKQLAMHVAAAYPKYLSQDEVDASDMEREKAVLRDQALAEGKPEEIVDKMITGRMRKYYEEICLLDQIYVMDNERTIAKVVEEAEKDVGAPVKLAGFARFHLGEGIQTEDADFAEEVATAVNG